MAAYHPIPRTSTSSIDDHDKNNVNNTDRLPTTPLLSQPPSTRHPASLSITARSIFRIDALVCGTIAIICLAISTHQKYARQSAAYTQSLVIIYLALGLSLLSQLAAVAGLSRTLHISVSWTGKTGPAVHRGPPAARQRRLTVGRVLGHGLLGLALLVEGLVLAIVAQRRWNPAAGVVGEVFCLLTGFVHLILAFLPAELLDSSLRFAITMAPAEELSEELKSPAVYQDVEEDSAREV
ncbi:hypothetical protein MMC34_004121 [Xylographa carneopallida]|nr:hypothetical protein [Xylographa carneopallida]